MRKAIWLPAGFVLAAAASANEVTVQNDSLANNSSGIIVTGFVAGEAAASWLTSPCGGSVVAAQVFWRSEDGTAAQVIEDSIDIYRAGDFPAPGALAAEIGGPVMTDGVMNEWRYLDENNTIPLDVPVDAGETFVVSLTFAEAPPAPIGPSVVRDTDGITPAGNALYGNVGQGLQWYDAATLGIAGDWVIRAVVDCQTAPNEADVGVAAVSDPTEYTAGATLTYTITVSNAGPAAAASTTVVDAFPAAYAGIAWTCAASGGASCAAGGSGGVLAENVGLPAGASVVYTVTGTVAAGTTAPLTNTVTAVVGAPATDPDPTNNTATAVTNPAPTDDTIFADGFDG